MSSQRGCGSSVSRVETHHEVGSVAIERWRFDDEMTVTYELIRRRDVRDFGRRLC